MLDRILLTGLILVSAGAFALGVWGFQLDNSERRLLSNAYLSAQLFTLESGAVVEPPNWQLEFARWLAPLSTLTGIVASLAFFWRQFRERLRACCLRGHSLVCGDSPTSRQLVEELPQFTRKPVAILDAPPDSADLSWTQQPNCVFIPGAADQPLPWRRAKIQRAKRVVCAALDDSTNLRHALLALEMLKRRAVPDEVELYLQVEDLPTRDAYQQCGVFDATPSSVRIRLVSPHWNQARIAWSQFPLECISRPLPDLRPRPRLVLPKLSPGVFALLIQAARIGHYRGGNRLQIDLVSSQMERDLSRLQRFYPGLQQCIDLNPIAIPEEILFWKIADQIIESASTEATTTIVAPDSPANEQLVIALGVVERRALGTSDFRVLLDPRGGEQTLLVEHWLGSHPQCERLLGVLPLLKKCCGVEAVFTASLDRVAREIHQAWYAAETERRGRFPAAHSETVKPAWKSWNELTELQRDVNRHAADHVPIKLRAAGVDPGVEQVASAWSQLDADIVEELARMEHNRWAAQLFLGGWTWGAERDASRKQHPNLVPYESLDESTRDFDRDQVRRAAEYWQKRCQDSFLGKES